GKAIAIDEEILLQVLARVAGHHGLQGVVGRAKPLIPADTLTDLRRAGVVVDAAAEAEAGAAIQDGKIGPALERRDPGSFPSIEGLAQNVVAVKLCPLLIGEGDVECLRA